MHCTGRAYYRAAQTRREKHLLSYARAVSDTLDFPSRFCFMRNAILSVLFQLVSYTFMRIYAELLLLLLSKTRKEGEDILFVQRLFCTSMKDDALCRFAACAASSVHFRSAGGLKLQRRLVESSNRLKIIIFTLQ